MRRLLHSYSAVLFCQSQPVGALLLLATMVVPEVGLSGLYWVVASLGFATALGLDRDALEAGTWSYSALLTGLLVGAWYPWGWTVALVGLVGALGSVLLQAALGGALRTHLGLPALSLPFVGLSWLLIGGTAQLAGVELRTERAWGAVQAGEDLLSAFGAIFAVPNMVSGGLVLAALALWSRIATVHALIGLGVGSGLVAALRGMPLGLDPLTLSFNCIFTSIALGSVFVLPGSASLVLSAAGALLAGAVSVGVARPLAAVGLGPLALPFNLVVLGTLYAFAFRRADAQPRLVGLPGPSPEAALRSFQTRQRRFGVRVPIRLRLPFRGTWLCTQGNNGAHTHQGLWADGLDFEVVDAEGKRHSNAGSKLSDWHCYGLPVCAPAVGTVVEVVDGLPDNAIGNVDTLSPWGNLVILQHGPGLFSVVAHLQPRSIRVKKGEVVSDGQELGRCGSSGRSPAPHLHFQLQPTAAIGDRTLPVAFHGTVRLGDVAEVSAEYCPKEGDKVANVQVDPALVRALALPPSRKLSTVLRKGEEVRSEELLSEVDSVGGRSLVSIGRPGRLWFDSREDTFVCYHYEGPQEGALFVIACAMSRLPLCGSRLQWTDHLDARQLGGVGWWEDLRGLVLPPTSLGLRYTLAEEDGIPTLRSSSEGPNPRIVSKTTLSRQRGIERIQLRLDGVDMELQCLS